MAVAELDDGRVVVTFVTPDGPADQAGIAVGAEILEMSGMPVSDFVDQVVPYSGPFGTESYKRLQHLRYATRATKDAEVPVTFKNLDAGEAETTVLGAVEESESFRFTSFLRGVTGTELPVEFELLPQGIGYVKLNSFSDNQVLTVQLWETMMRTLNSFGIPALVIDMRQNGGGSGFLADQMAAYFFDKPLELGNAAIYDDERGDFYADPNRVDRYYLPDESLRYPGAVAIIAGPQCLSACEFFAYDMTLEDRAQIVSHYPTGGAGGPRILVTMPDGVRYFVTIGRAEDMDGNIHIEGKGVPPTVQVPVTEETVFYEGDALLDAAVAAVTGQPQPFGAVESAGEPAAGTRRAAGSDRGHDRNGRRTCGRGHRRTGSDRGHDRHDGTRGRGDGRTAGDGDHDRDGGTRGRGDGRAGGEWPPARRPRSPPAAAAPSYARVPAGSPPSSARPPTATPTPCWRSAGTASGSASTSAPPAAGSHLLW